MVPLLRIWRHVGIKTCIYQRRCHVHYSFGDPIFWCSIARMHADRRSGARDTSSDHCKHSIQKHATTARHDMRSAQVARSLFNVLKPIRNGIVCCSMLHNRCARCGALQTSIFCPLLNVRNANADLILRSDHYSVTGKEKKQMSYASTRHI